MNRIILNLLIAWRSLNIYKIRSFFAMLGVFLGTFSLIVVSNLSGSFTEKMLTEIDKMGTNLLIVKNGIVKHFGRKTELLSEAAALTIDDSVAIMQGSTFIKNVSPACNKTFTLRYKGKVLTSILIVGVSPNYQETRSCFVQKGRFISKADNTDLNRVVVLGTRVVERLFDDKKNPVGKYILIARVPFLVTGIMEEKGADISGADQDNQVIIPLNTFMKRLVKKDFIDTIYVQAENEDSIPLAQTEVELILRKRHRIADDKDDDFTVIDLKDFKDLKTKTTDMITILGRISAVVSFLIGGIGILSIMILIVNERRVEIGIRRAVGAKKKDIIFQFLMESSIISLCGGIAGVLAGFSLSIIIFKLSNLPLNISIAGLIFSFIASVTVGTIAGIYPSKSAIAIQPVDIIRS